MKKPDTDARQSTMLHLRELLTVATVTGLAACQPDEVPLPKAPDSLPVATGQAAVDATVVPDAGATAPDLVDASVQDAAADASGDSGRPHPRRDAGVLIKPAPRASGYEVVDMLPPPARRPPPTPKP